MTPAQLKDRIEQLEARRRKLPIDPSTLSKAQLIQSYWQLKIKSEYWEAQYRAAIKHDGRIIDTLRFAQPPCYRCGYNGAGYYQPRTHSCAAHYHLTEEVQHGAAESRGD